jgi:metal-responsive CopG/Arc/MetJ family transcriptional regulator
VSQNRGLVTRSAFSNSIRKDLAEQFDELHKKTEIPKSKLLDQAIQLLLEKYSTKEGA